MKKLLKILGVLLLLFIIVISIFYLRNNEKLPKGIENAAADSLAIKMQKALNIEAFNSTELIEWSFKNEHFYKWDKTNNTVKVSWEQNVVVLDTKQPSNNQLINNNSNKTEAELFKLATSFFNNDSFWLIAPFKVFDKGVSRKIVDYNNRKALLVTYSSGGNTPGDSYLWILDEKGFPTSYKMWVNIIPIGGVEASWKDWTLTETGMYLPTKHAINLFGLEFGMGKVKTSNPKADAFARKMLNAINHNAYKNTRYLEWSFRNRRFYKWDKKEHIVELNGNKNKIILHPNDIVKSTILVHGKESFEDKERIINRALATFNNDSFWLVAPHKLFEPGIIRSIVKVDGKDALKVKYTTGGSTPGDSYIWLVDDKYIPTAYKMYIPSMQMNGVSATWENWITTDSGTKLPLTHTFDNGRVLNMGTVKGYN